MAKAYRASARFELQHFVDAVRNHALYGHVTDDGSLRVLMRKQVFAVWDFQSLLKALQRSEAVDRAALRIAFETRAARGFDPSS